MPNVSNVLDVLMDRGFVAQLTDEAGLRRYLDAGATCYVGFDPTADSLHVGHLLPVLALVHMQKHGHRPVVLVGGGTGMVGDPSGKTEMRQLLDLQTIRSNVEAIGSQLSRFIDFSGGKALILNNADWLLELRYIEFLREIGRYFSVNRMLAAESYKARLESGLSFIEFNYMLLQAYDFYYLAEHHQCLLQMGGNDQWGNIVAGVDLIRRKLGKESFGLTFPLLTTATGEKMGKTAAGAVWLSGDRTSAYDFFQYWVNVDDRDVVRFLKLYTFLPLEEIQAVESLEGQELNACKAVLAYEATALVHGREAALSAFKAAGQAFGRRTLPEDILPSSSIPRKGGQEAEAIPTSYFSEMELSRGIPAVELFVACGLAASKSAARRLIEQGGAYVNGERIGAVDSPVSLAQLGRDGILLRAGKKKVHRVQVGR